MNKCVLALGVLLIANAAPAQSVVRDSLYDPVNEYWRARATLALSTRDTLAITCEHDYERNAWGPEVRVTVAQGWSPDAVGTSSVSMFGVGTTKTASRISLRWPPQDIDFWEVVFATKATNAFWGAGALDANMRARDLDAFTSASLKNGPGFVRRLAQHGRVAFLYPAGSWYRAGEWILGDDARAAVRDMAARCGKAREGQPKPAR